MTDSHTNRSGQAGTSGPTSRLVGLLAEFASPDKLVHACDEARQAGIRRMDAYSPFPVHGIDPAIGITRTKLPFLVLAVGLSGLFVALGLQYAVNATDSIGPFPGYPFLISGKPLFSLPANIPVTFEVIVLSSAFAAFLGSLAMNGLPRFANPLHRVPRFKRATNDGFFLLVQAEDPNYNPRQIRNQLEQWGADAIEEVHEDLTDHKLPSFVKTVIILVAALCLLPPALIFRARGDSYTLPRLHVVPDMDWQFKSKAQQVAPNIAVGDEAPRVVFADQRVMRGAIPGTIIRGQLRDDAEFFTGVANSGTDAGHAATTVEGQGPHFVSTGAPSATSPQDAAAPEPAWVATFPSQVEISEATIQRGQERFNIYCAVCHGVTGEGNGMVNQRALSLNSQGKAAWVNAKSLHDYTVVDQPVGRIFDTISNGRGGMGPYKAQIPVADRWAIVLYVKALQESLKDAVVKDEDGNWVPVRTVAPPAEAAAGTDATPAPETGESATGEAASNAGDSAETAAEQSEAGQATGDGATGEESSGEESAG